MDPILIPVVVALIAAFGSLYTTHASKDTIAVAASKNAVETVNEALETLRGDNVTLKDENVGLRGRVKVLEDEAVVVDGTLKEALLVGHECRSRIRSLTDAVERMGGTVDQRGDVHDRAD